MATLKKFSAWLISAVMLLTNLCFSEINTAGAYSENISVYGQDDGAILYDADTEELFVSRTMQEIADEYSAALYAIESYDNSDNSTWYSSVPSFGGYYDPGMITTDTHEAMIAMTNFYRWLIGVQPVTGNMEDTPALQACALIRNYDFNHFVRDEYKPADMPDELWAYGAEVNHSILASGYTPQGSITGWMNEGYLIESDTWESIGHRATLTKMSLSQIAFGHCGNITAGVGVKYKNDRVLPFTSFPSPGYMPSDLLNPLLSAWSIELNPDVLYLDDTYDAQVTITNLNTGETFTRSADEETLILSFGCITFKQPDDFGENGYTDSYKVELTGIYDYDTDEPAKISYTVKFFSLNDCRQTAVTSVDTCMKYMIGPDMMNGIGLDIIAAILPDEVSVLADNGQLFTAPVNNEWIVDTANNCFVNSASVSNLPSRVSDPNGLLQYITIPFEEKTGMTAEYDTLDIVPSVVDAGGRVSIAAYRTSISTDTVHIFKLIDNPDGSQSSKLIFDSNDHPTGDSSVTEGFTIESASAEDNGRYMSVYFNKAWLEDRHLISVYVSNYVSQLTVNGAETTTTESTTTTTETTTESTTTTTETTTESTTTTTQTTTESTTTTTQTTTESTTTTTETTTESTATTTETTTESTATTTETTTESTATTTETTTESTATTTETTVSIYQPITSSNNTTVDDILLGDINLDGEVSILDIVKFSKYNTSIVNLNETQRHAADCNCDSKIDFNDLIILMRYVIRLTEDYEIK